MGKNVLPSNDNTLTFHLLIIVLPSSVTCGTLWILNEWDEQIH